MRDWNKRLLRSHRSADAKRHLLARTALFVWLVGAAGPGDGGARADDALLSDLPPVMDATAEVDSQVNLWLSRAMAAIGAGEPDNALELLLPILRADPAAMTSTNGVTFRPARTQAAQLMRTLPERTLASYRLRADASMNGLVDRLAAPVDVAALAAAYNKRLPGIPATEVGLRLAGLYLDQERFRDARRVLLYLLDEDPAPPLLRPELLARLVVACARVEDMARAEWAWAELQKNGDTNRWSALASELRRPAASTGPVSNAWPMAYGGPSRDGAVPGSELDLATNSGWMLRWGLDLGPGMVRRGPDAESRSDLPPKFMRARDYATIFMIRMNQRPSDDVIFAGNKAWMNGFDELVTVDLDSGRVTQRTAHNTDDQAKGVRWAIDGSWVFGNRLNHAAGLVGGRVYCVEDNYRSSLRRDARKVREWVDNKYVYRTLHSGNALVAYEADTGRMLWRIGREVPVEPPVQPRGHWQVNTIRFAAAPVPCAGLLLASVENDSGLGAVGLDADSGMPVWRTQLASKLPPTAPRAAPVTVTVAGTSAYLCGGNGSVTALDGCDGTVLWTTLYEPFSPSLPTNPASYAGTVLWTNMYEPLYLSSATIRVDKHVKSETTWEDNLTLVVGETVVAMPGDSGEILAFNRSNGARLWTQPKPKGVNYVLGMRDTALIVAGTRTVACVDLASGRERWRTPIEGSTGRGVLCGQEALIPRGHRILRLRIADGTLLGAMPAQTMDGLPLGNLYVNGNQLLVAGLERLYALVDARPALARLEESLTRQPTAEAYAARGRLYAGIERHADAVPDLREAWKRERGSEEKESIRGSLLRALWSAAAQDSGIAERSSAEAQKIATTVAERAESTWRWAQCRERAGNTNGALALYAAVFAVPDVPLAASPGESDHPASVHRLAGHRIRALLADDKAKGWSLLEKPAAEALARLGPAADRAALVEMATFFPGTIAGREAAIKAAQLAADGGDMGMAEATLQRALALASPSNRVALAEEMVRLYDRMKWPRGAAQLRDEWPRLGDGAPAPKFIEDAAAKAVGVPLPPWRQRWRQRISSGIGRMVLNDSLFYWDSNKKETGCLDLATGRSRWRKDGVFGPMPGQQGWDNQHLLLVYNGEHGACIDTWSGAMMTNALFHGPPTWVRDRGGHEHNPMTLGRIGLTTVNPPPSYANLACVDVLTGKVAWRRGDMDTLLDWLMWSIPVSSSSTGIILSSIETDETRVAVALDPWTGAVTARRSFDAGAFGAWAQRMYGRDGSEDATAMDRGHPVLENGRLTVKNLRTGATAWRSAPDIAIARHRIMPGGMLLAQTDTEESLLLNGSDGRIKCRSGEVRFAFDEASFLGNAVVLSRRTADGASEVIVLDPVAGRSLFHGRLPEHASPLMSLGPTMPDQLLVRMDVAGKQWVQVVNTLGKETNKKWRLPAGSYHPVFTDGLIVLLGDGELLAYEHDPE